MVKWCILLECLKTVRERKQADRQKQDSIKEHKQEGMAEMHLREIETAVVQKGTGKGLVRNDKDSLSLCCSVCHQAVFKYYSTREAFLPLHNPNRNRHCFPSFLTSRSQWKNRNNIIIMLKLYTANEKEPSWLRWQRRWRGRVIETEVQLMETNPVLCQSLLPCWCVFPRDSSKLVFFPLDHLVTKNSINQHKLVNPVQPLYDVVKKSVSIWSLSW